MDYIYDFLIGHKFHEWFINENEPRRMLIIKLRLAYQGILYPHFNALIIRNY